MKDIIRAVVFGITFFTIFLGLVYCGMEVNEELGVAFLVFGALVTSAAVTVVLAWFVSWLFTDSKPAKQETLTDEEKMKMVDTLGRRVGAEVIKETSKDATT